MDVQKINRLILGLVKSKGVGDGILLRFRFDPALWPSCAASSGSKSVSQGQGEDVFNMQLRCTFSSGAAAPIGDLI